MITKQDLLNEREQMQEDLMCELDFLPDGQITQVCQVIVNGMNRLIKKMDKANEPNEQVKGFECECCHKSFDDLRDSVKVKGKTYCLECME